MAQASVVYLSSARPSVNLDFSEAAAWVQAKICGKLPIYHILFFFVFFSKIFNIYDFFSFSSTWDHMGASISKNTTSPTVSV